MAVVTVVEAAPRWLGVFEWSPVTIRMTIRTMTAATAANGPPSRRGRRSMECMAGSSVPVMKLLGPDSGSAGVSSKVIGSAGLGTGGGGTGGTIVPPGSVRRTFLELETRKALAGYDASPLPLSGANDGFEPNSSRV